MLRWESKNQTDANYRKILIFILVIVQYLDTMYELVWSEYLTFCLVFGSHHMSKYMKPFDCWTWPEIQTCQYLDPHCICNQIMLYQHTPLTSIICWNIGILLKEFFGSKAKKGERKGKTKTKHFSTYLHFIAFAKLCNYIYCYLCLTIFITFYSSILLIN